MTYPLNRLQTLHRRGTRVGLALALAAASLLVPHATRAQDTTTDPTTPGVYAAGDDVYGQLGNGTTNNTFTTTPVAVSNANGFTNTGVTAVAGGGLHSLAIQGGAVFAWGYNGYGQLGTGTTNNSNVPVPVNILTSGVTAVAGGADHSLAIQGGAVFAWGYNGYGELGTGTTNNSNVPVPVNILTSGVTAVAGGGFHSLAIQGGAVFAWGYNGYGELGNGTTNNSNVPGAVSVANGFTNTGVTAVAGGGFHSLAIQGGAVFAWGYNGNGELGNGTTAGSILPVAVSGLTSGATAVAGGAVHSLALVNGQVYAWGSNNFGQLGTGDTNSSNVPKAITVGNAGNQVVAITATENGSFAVDASGNLYMWGIYIGEASEGISTRILTPQIISAPPQGFAYTLASANSQGDHVVPCSRRRCPSSPAPPAARPRSARLIPTRSPPPAAPRATPPPTCPKA